MKAPDKIHITEGKNNCGILTGYWHSIRGVLIKTEEYIRKDALLEWAKGQLAACDGAVAMHRSYDKLIDKLNSL